MDLQRIGEILEEILVETLEEKRYPTRSGKLTDKVASGSLRDSIRAFGTETELSIEMNDYGAWVQSGRAPGKKGVPIDALLKWMDDRNIKPKSGSKESMAFAIQYNIKKFGIRPTNWLDISLDKIIESPEIEEALGESTVEELIDAIEGI